MRVLSVFFLSLMLLFASACGNSAINSSSNSSNVSKNNSEKDTITIGMSTALTGPYSEYGVGNSRGVELAIDKWNENGGINGKKIALKLLDDQLDADKGVTNIQQLLADSEIDAIIGPAGSNVALATVPITESKGMVHMNPGSQTIEIAYPDGVGKPPRKNVFSFAMQNDIEGKALGKSLGKHWKKIGIIHESTPYGKNLGDIISKELESKYNIQPVAREEYNQGVADMTSQLSILKNAGAEVIVSLGVAADTANVRKGMDRLGVNAELVATALTPPYFEGTGDLAAGTITSTIGVLLEDTLSPEAQEFADAYKKKYGVDRYWGSDENRPQLSMSVFVITAYDAANVLFEAIKNADSLKSEDIIKSLESIKDYKGVNATYTFNEQKHHAVTEDAIGLFKYVKEGDEFQPVPYN